MPPLHSLSTNNAMNPTSISHDFTLCRIIRNVAFAICLVTLLICTVYVSNVLLRWMCDHFATNAIAMRMMKFAELGGSEDEDLRSDTALTMADDAEDTAHICVNGSKAENAHIAGWASLFNFTRRVHIIPLLAAIALAIASGIVIPALAYFLGKIFDSFTEYGANRLSDKGLTEKVSHDCIYLAGLGSASWLLNGGYFLFWLLFGELQARSVRDEVFNAMLEKDLEWFEMRKDGIGALLPRLQTQIRELQLATSQPLGFALQYTATMFAALGLAFYTSWKLTLVTLATVPVSAVILSFMSSKIQPSIDSQKAELNKAAKFANNAISSIEVVKCFNGQQFEVGQYSLLIRRAARWYLRQACANAFQIAFVRVVTLGMFVQGFWYGSILVRNGEQNAGDVLTAFWACLIATQSIEQILPQMLVLEKGRASGAALRAVLIQVDKGKKASKVLGKLTPTFCEGDIEVRNVTFSYPSRPQFLALDDATFFFPAGETTFVVGRSGSGKSTLGNLLMRFYSPKSGTILVDGNPLQTLDINWLRNNITLVQQQSILFNETVFRNIAFGRRDYAKVKKEQIKKSIEVAMLQHTINDQPKGLETVVGSGGSAMSGGQRQRIAIARARLRDTPIIILDESTSALDYISRTLVMNAIREWRKEKTTIIITHDMSQILDHDFVYVMENGRICEEGYRHSLKTTGGLFSNLNIPETAPPQYGEQTRSPISELPIAPPPTSFQETIARNILPSMLKEDDILDIHVRPKRIIVPSMYGQFEESRPYRRPSQGLISPLTPVYFSPGRPSVDSSVFLGTDKQQRLGLLSPLLMRSPYEFEMIEMRGIRSRLSQAKSVRALRRDWDGALHLRSGVGESPRSLKSRKAKAKLSPDEKRQQIASIKSILLTVWPNLRWKHRPLLVVGFICALFHAAATPVFSWVFSQLLSTFFLRTHRAERAMTWSLSILAVAAVDATASFFMHYLLELCGQHWVDTLRVEALKRVLDQPRGWFDRDKNSLSKLIACLDRNAEEMRNLVGRFAGFAFVAVSMMIMAVIWSMILCWKLTLVGLATAPLLYVVTRAFESISGKWERRSNDAGELAGSIFSDTFSDIRIVRALTLESYFHRKYSRATSKAMTIGFKRSAYSGLFFGLSDSGIVFVTALIFYYGAILVSSKTVSTNDILTVFTMLLFSIATANSIVGFIPQINSSRDTATRLLRLANLPFGASHEHSGRLCISEPGSINFINLSFAYPSRLDTLALQNLSLTIPAHSCTAIVGASGSGKSSIASLLLGLYLPRASRNDPPSLTIGGRDIRVLDIPALRSLIAIVPQTPTLFPSTIATNIAYGLPRSSHFRDIASIQAAASGAGIHDFIISLPQGYDTVIGDGGLGISGGQAQRIVIARALARRPRILILDEATSSLDSESAAVVKQTVKRLVEGAGDTLEMRSNPEKMTIIIITHAKELMEVAQNVVVMEQGQVVEEGPYEALCREDGKLRRMLMAGGGLELE